MSQGPTDHERAHARRVNPLAPGLTGELSAEATEQVAARLAAGGLSPHACPDERAIRREDRPDDRPTVLRSPFLRDAEKVMHMSAYNRMGGKTQVFSFRADDDLTRRGLHVQLVARIARDIGRALGLNVELIEAIGLAHDLGHTPFGHAGERYLGEVFHERTGRHFFHNVQSVRVLDVLAGRNLCLQTLDGVICHNGEFEQQVFETSDLQDFAGFDAVVDACWRDGKEAIGHLRPMTLEGCVVRVCDIIAYVGKDRQDAIRAGICDEGSFEDGLGGAYNAWALGAFAADVVEHSLGKPRIAMSAEGFAEMRRAKAENWEKIYGSAEVNGDFADGMRELFARLYEHELDALARGDEGAAVFAHHVRPVERHLAPYGRRYRWEDDPELTVVDFISSMSDDYFMATCEALFDAAADLFPHRSYFDGRVRP